MQLISLLSLTLLAPLAAQLEAGLPEVISDSPTLAVCIFGQDETPTLSKLLVCGVTLIVFLGALASAFYYRVLYLRSQERYSAVRELKDIPLEDVGGLRRADDRPYNPTVM